MEVGPSHQQTNTTCNEQFSTFGWQQNFMGYVIIAMKTHNN
jgi:hypothetical protein